MHLELNVFENDLENIKVGQKVLFMTQNASGKKYPAKVKLINRSVDPEKRTIKIHAHIEDSSLESTLNPGMYIQAEIFTTNENRLALPSEALVELDNTNYVLVLQKKDKEGYSFLRQKVEPGLVNEKETEILNSQDFNTNSQFLVKGAFNLIKE